MTDEARPLPAPATIHRKLVVAAVRREPGLGEVLDQYDVIVLDGMPATEATHCDLVVRTAGIFVLWRICWHGAWEADRGRYDLTWDRAVALLLERI